MAKDLAGYTHFHIFGKGNHLERHILTACAYHNINMCNTAIFGDWTTDTMEYGTLQCIHNIIMLLRTENFKTVLPFCLLLQCNFLCFFHISFYCLAYERDSSVR